jgi:hypothetical protein
MRTVDLAQQSTTFAGHKRPRQVIEIASTSDQFWGSADGMPIGRSVSRSRGTAIGNTVAPSASPETTSQSSAEEGPTAKKPKVENSLEPTLRIAAPIPVTLRPSTDVDTKVRNLRSKERHVAAAEHDVHLAQRKLTKAIGELLKAADEVREVLTTT